MFSPRKRTRALALGTLIVIASSIGLTGCSSDDAASTDAVTEAAATEAAATEAADTEAAATEAADTAAVASEAISTDAAGSGTDGAAGGDALKATLISEMLKGMNGGVAADQADIDCVAAKVTEKDISALMTASGGGAIPADAVPVMKAIFGCKPKPLMDSFVTSSFSDMPAEVTADQKTCIADKFFDFIANDDETLQSMVSNSAQAPAKFKTEGVKIVKECVPGSAAQEKLIAEINKN